LYIYYNYNQSRQSHRIYDAAELVSFLIFIILSGVCETFPTVVSHLVVVVGLCTDDPKDF